MSLRVLVVDDSLTDLTKLQQIVSGAGHTVISATSGSEAIEKALADPPSAIFLDVIMDGKNGFQTCRELKKLDQMSEVPIFLVTSKSQRADYAYAKQVGAAALIAKPYEAEQILNCLKEV